MPEREWLADSFEKHRTHLRAVAYRMLGSMTEADEAVQETWLRLSRGGIDGVENLGGWMTTIVARVCLNVLQARKSRPEHASGLRMPEPVVSRDDGTDPEQAAVLADSIGLALLVVLNTLAPAERLAFVLHDMFDLPFEEIAPMVQRSSTAARQLASRARRKIQGAAVPAVDRLARQHKVVQAFFAAAQAGDFDALLKVLDPDVVSRSDGGIARPQDSGVVRGAKTVARMAQAFARAFAQKSVTVLPVLVNGAAGALIVADGYPIRLMGFTVSRGKIIAIDRISDPAFLNKLDVTALAV